MQVLGLSEGWQILHSNADLKMTDASLLTLGHERTLINDFKIDWMLQRCNWLEHDLHIVNFVKVNQPKY